MEETDGPLFRGRYKAILIEPDAYLLNVSRYVHLNPVVAGMVFSAKEYQWSSYRAYMGTATTPEWLQTKFVFDMLGRHQRRKSYQLFVEQGIDETTWQFYDKKKQSAVMGSDDFKESVYSRLPTNAEIPEIKKLKSVPSIASIIRAVSFVFTTPENEILKAKRGRGMKNPARSAAIYCCRKLAGLPLNKIAARFGLNHYGSVSGSIAKFQRQMDIEAHLAGMLCKVENILNE